MLVVMFDTQFGVIKLDGCLKASPGEAHEFTHAGDGC